MPLRGLDKRLSRGESLALPQVYTELATLSEVVVAIGGVDQLADYINPEQLRRVPIEELFHSLQFLRTLYQLDWALPSVAIIGCQVEAQDSWYPQRENLMLTLSRRRLATEALIKQRRLVLLGDPGGGKSTFVRYLAWALARRAISPAEVTDPPGWDPQAQRLPIILPLRTLAGRLARDGVREQTVYAALRHALHEYCVHQIDDALTEALSRGAALLLFDGLDEVPLESGPNSADRRTTALRPMRTGRRVAYSMRVRLDATHLVQRRAARWTWPATSGSGPRVVGSRIQAQQNPLHMLIGKCYAAGRGVITERILAVGRASGIFPT